jgi:hypothetical protein
MPKYAAATLALLLPLGAPASADAFWQHSQWSRCADAPTAAEWSRYRCWEIEPYHYGALGPGFGDGPSLRGKPRSAVRGRMAPGGPVMRRLG